MFASLPSPARRLRLPALVCLAALTFHYGAVPVADAEELPPIPPIPRLLPPEGIEIPAEIRQRLEARLEASQQRLQAIPLSKHSWDAVNALSRTLAPADPRADVEIFTKAVELALRHREFYSDKDFAKADWALDEANKRLDALAEGESPWTKATGLIVRGYRSSIDDSAQPFGLVIPENHDFSKPCPLYVWLHGRGDKSTDLHFLYERATKIGQIAPPGAIVLHPFGRHCVGYKHAGEFDIFEAINRVEDAYLTDRDRTVLIGFSMGGAGAWHVGAHWATDFVAISPGAGFAETARYQKLTPDKFPPQYEQALWGQYDTPNYVRNLFNTTVIAYSGENDKQIQAARVMEEAYRAEGRELTHLIGPGVERKYEPETLAELLRRIESVVAAGRPEVSPTVHLQTRTLAYPIMHWITVRGLAQHWQDSRVDAEIINDKRIRATTKNITALRLTPRREMRGVTIEIDGQAVTLGEKSNGNLYRDGDTWKAGEVSPQLIRKNTSVHGPIDDCFMERFVVVIPTGKSRNPRFQQWVEFELNHFRNRWRELMRADLPEVRDVDLTKETADKYPGNWVLWGDADSNSVIRRVNEQLPVQSHDGHWRWREQKFDGNQFVPALIYPFHEADPDRSPRAPMSYVVLNSGLTFREGHDRTNSLQNPKLPDWAIIDLAQLPDAFAPGRIHDAGFFDEQWQLQSQPIAP